MVGIYCMGDFCESNQICTWDVLDVTVSAVTVINTILSDIAYPGLDSAVESIVTLRSVK